MPINGAPSQYDEVGSEGALRKQAVEVELINWLTLVLASSRIGKLRNFRMV